MKKRKITNAFTLIEIVSVIVIIGMFLLLTFPTISRAVLMSQLKYYESQEMSLLTSGRNYFSSDRTRLPKNVGEKSIISLSTLVEEGYIDPIVDTENRECNLNESYVQATNIDKGEYQYYVRLLCADYDTVTAFGEWSNWSTEVPIGDNIEVESATFYNYQNLTSYNGSWSDWTDVVAESRSEIEPVSRIIGTEREDRTVYSFVDQQWRWFVTGTENQCASSTPTGTGWTQGAGCSTAIENQCATSTPTGTGWSAPGAACNWTNENQCATSTPTGTGWSAPGAACAWTPSTENQCATSTPSGSGWGAAGAACAWTPSTENQCATSTPSGSGWGAAGSACAWTTGTENQCATSTPSGSGWGAAGSACAWTPSTENQCATSTPSGSGWGAAGSACAWTPSTENQCATSTPSGSGWGGAGSACAWTTGTENQCATSTPSGSGWGAAGSACAWTPSTENQCATSTPSGSGWGAAGAACAWTPSTENQCATSTPSGSGWGAAGSACAWTTGTETSACSSSTPPGGGWSFSSWCGSSYERISNFHYGRCDFGSGLWTWDSCSGNCGAPCPAGFTVTGSGWVSGFCGGGWSCASGAIYAGCTETWRGQWCDPTTARYTRSVSVANSWWYSRTVSNPSSWWYSRTVSNPSSWWYSRTVSNPSSWWYSRTVSNPSSWWYSRTVSNPSSWWYSRTVSNPSSWWYSRTVSNPSSWWYSRTVSNPSSWWYSRTVSNPSSWWYSRTVSNPSSWTYTRSVPSSWTYTRSVTDRWTFTRPTTTYATGFHSTSPSGFPTRDDAQFQFTSPTAWSDVVPTSHSFRTISNKQQFRTRNLITDWSGNVLAQHVTETQLTTILNRSMQEIQADPNIRLVPIVMYRFRVSRV